MSVVQLFPGNASDDAWRVHRALALAELREPDLRGNPLWRQERRAAYQKFETMLGAAK